MPFADAFNRQWPWHAVRQEDVYQHIQIIPMNRSATTLLTLAVGTAIGVLIAPASGRETRRRIMEKGSWARDTLHYLVMEAGDLVDQLRALIGNFETSSTNGDGERVGAGREQRRS
jgi:gas vesicle protein